MRNRAILEDRKPPHIAIREQGLAFYQGQVICRELKDEPGHGIILGIFLLNNENDDAIRIRIYRPVGSGNADIGSADEGIEAVEGSQFEGLYIHLIINPGNIDITL